MEKVIITGGTGTIGMALIKECIKRETEVLVLCRANSSHSSRIPEHPLIVKKYCSLQDLSIINNDTDKEFNVFYHLAWEGTTGAARNDYRKQNKNVQYALDALDAAERFGCKVFVGAGSQAEYGNVDGILKPETPAFPNTGYGMAKLCAGMMTRAYASQKKIRHVWVRILSVYGPFGNEQSIIIDTIRKLGLGEETMFTKGEQLWDFLYCEDAANALYDLGKKGKDGKVYVLGSGNSKPLADYICQLRNIINPTANLGFGSIPYESGQIMNLQADISDITNDTGWFPKFTFEEGIKKMLRNSL